MYNFDVTLIPLFLAKTMNVPNLLACLLSRDCERCSCMLTQVPSATFQDIHDEFWILHRTLNFAKFVFCIGHFSYSPFSSFIVSVDSIRDKRSRIMNSN